MNNTGGKDYLYPLILTRRKAMKIQSNFNFPSDRPFRGYELFKGRDDYYVMVSYYEYEDGDKIKWVHLYRGYPDANLNRPFASKSIKG